MEELDAMFGDEDDQRDIEQQDLDGSITRPVSSGVCSFHNGTEEALYLYVIHNAVEGDYMGILRTIDKFCYEQHWMMHAGDKKLPIIGSAVKQALNGRTQVPLTAVEFGSYCGYSAIFIASLLNSLFGDMLYCVESNIDCVKWTERMVSFAGLSDRVKVINQPANNCNEWKQQISLHRSSGNDRTVHDSNIFIDILFIDHDKASYLNDLQATLHARMLKTGSVVVADNVLCFNAPLTHYLSFVRDENGPFRSSTLHETLIEYAVIPKDHLVENHMPLRDSNGTYLEDGIEVSVVS